MPYLGKSPARGLVGTSDIDASAVTQAKIADDAISLAKIASGTDGELITWDASGNPAAVAVGTATHVLTSNGAGYAPTFQAAGGGAYQFIDDTNCTTQSEFTVENLSATYDNYLFVMAGVVNASATSSLRIYLGTGSSYASSGYYYGRAGVGFGTSGGGDTGGQNANYIEISSQGPTGSTRNYFFHFLRKSNNATRGLITGINVGNENATWDESYYSFGGYADTGSLLNSIKFKMESNTSTISVGSCRVYGLANS